MKNIFIFATGFLFGIFFCFISSETTASSETTTNTDRYGLSNIKMFKEKGKCISRNNLEVFQALDTGFALIREENNYDKIMLISSSENKDYYDGEKIILPKNKCFRQIGIFKYKSRIKTIITVPVVIID